MATSQSVKPNQQQGGKSDQHAQDTQHKEKNKEQQDAPRGSQHGSEEDEGLGAKHVTKRVQGYSQENQHGKCATNKPVAKMGANVDEDVSEPEDVDENSEAAGDDEESIREEDNDEPGAENK